MNELEIKLSSPTIDTQKMINYIIKIIQPLHQWIGGVFLTFLSFITPLAPLVVVTTLVALFDWVFKIYTLYITKGKKEITSTKMKDTFIKIIVYALFIFTLFVVDTLFFKNMCKELFDLIFEKSISDWVSKIQLTSIGVLLILTRETKSIDENWESAFGISPLDIIAEKFSWLFKLKQK